MIHQTLAAGRWQKMTLAEQMGNIGSEFDRALSWKHAAQSDKLQSALARFLELINLTLADPRWQGPRRKEIARLKEDSLVVLTSGSLADGYGPLQDYFLQFAILARANR